jgi:hypothetical protein
VKPAWAILYLLAGLLGGLAMGFVFGLRHARQSVPPGPPPWVQPPAAARAEGLAVEQDPGPEATERLRHLDRELAELKTAHRATRLELAEAERAAGLAATAFADLRRERDGLHDTLARLERELEAHTAPTSDERAHWERQIRLLEQALVEASGAAPEFPPGSRAVRLLRLAPGGEVMALDQGAEAGLGAGSRWWLEASGHRLAIELTEVREGFAIARRASAEPSALELASGNAYRLTPLP